MPFCQFYYPNTQIYSRILNIIAAKQNSLCHGCEKRFEDREMIVRGEGKTPRYYHLLCAKKHNIVDEYAIEMILAGVAMHSSDS